MLLYQTNVSRLYGPPMLIQGNRMELEGRLSPNLWILENRKVIRK